MLAEVTTGCSEASEKSDGSSEAESESELRLGSEEDLDTSRLLPERLLDFLLVFGPWMIEVGAPPILPNVDC